MYPQLKFHLKLLAYLLVALVLIQLVNSVTSGWLSSFGIRPRELSGLIGIPLAPFIHHGWFHLFSNLLPLAVLMLLVAQMGTQLLWQASLGIVLLGGLAVWLLASSGVHAGASGLVFGYWGFLLTYGWFNKKLKSLLIAFVVLFLYGGLIFSFVSFRPYISWASHFYGAAAGGLMAWLLAKLNHSET